MNKQYSFLSGLPRTGSTLLCSILSQNPSIHAEGLSHVSNLMWQVFKSSANENLTNWNNEILASEKQESVGRIIKSIPDLYYQDVNKPFILDKGRTWTNEKFHLILKYITDKPKIIVLVRPLEEVISSLVRVRQENKWTYEEIFEKMLTEEDSLTEIIESVLMARQCDQDYPSREFFLFVHYDEIVFDTQKTLKKIYDFCGWPKFEHHLNDIKRPFVQNDHVYDLIGLHDVRKTIEKQKYHVDLPTHILEKCRSLNPLILS
jgi:sulfotransferase